MEAAPDTRSNLENILVGLTIYQDQIMASVVFELEMLNRQNSCSILIYNAQNSAKWSISATAGVAVRFTCS